jgi:hypothetical protein
MSQLQSIESTGSMPISMAVDSNLLTDPAVATTGTVKDLDYFRREFGKAILTFYRSTKKVADLLLEARITLSPGEFKQLVTDELQFDPSTVYKLIKSAADFRLNDPKNQAILPEAWTVRYEIIMMKEETFRIGVTTGAIHANCTLADLKKLRERMETPKRKKASATAKTKGKDSTAVATTQTPNATTAQAKAEEPKPQAKKVAVKAQINTSGLHVDAKASNGEPATATATEMAPAPAKGHIKIVLPKEVADQHQQDLVRIVDEIQAVVKHYEFIGGVGLEVAA